MLRAVADIGSNTVKYGIYEVNEKTSLPKRIYFESNTLRLISHIKNGILEKSTLENLINLLSEYRKGAQRKGAVSFDIFATEWIRKTDNAEFIKGKIEKSLGCDVDILPGKTEAKLSQLAMSHELPDIKCGISADMGGGSTELIKFERDKIIDSVSLPFGCVILKELFVKSSFPSESETESIISYVQSELSGLKFNPESETLCLIGGSAKALEKLCEIVCDSGVTKDSLRLLYDKLSESKEDAERILKANVSERADTAIPALAAFLAICEKVNPKSVRIVKSGTREGYLIDKYSEEVNNE